MKKKTKKLLFFSTAALLGMYAYNRFIEETATKKNMLPTKNGSYFMWNQGNIFYTKTGTGAPILPYMTRIRKVLPLSGQR